MRKLSHLVAIVMFPLSLALSGCSDGGESDDPTEETDETEDELTGEGYAEKILRNGNRIHLTTVHTSGVRDNADAKQNIVDMASGRSAATSAYGDAGGRRVKITHAVLKGMWKLSTRFTYTVTEVSGGDHSSGSLHYAGRAIDVSSINGRGVGSGAPHAAFMQMCRSLGADEVLGPGYPDHSTHVHCGWR